MGDAFCHDIYYVLLQPNSQNRYYVFHIFIFLTLQYSSNITSTQPNCCVVLYFCKCSEQ